MSQTNEKLTEDTLDEGGEIEDLIKLIDNQSSAHYLVVNGIKDEIKDLGSGKIKKVMFDLVEKNVGLLLDYTEILDEAYILGGNTRHLQEKKKIYNTLNQIYDLKIRENGSFQEIIKEIDSIIVIESRVVFNYKIGRLLNNLIKDHINFMSDEKLVLI